MNDMRELLSGALPAPQDEPQQRDVIDAAIDWGTRRRRRDWALSGAAALAVVAVGTGIAAMAGGSGNGVSAGGVQARGKSLTFTSGAPGGNPACDVPSGTKETLAVKAYCQLYSEERNFGVDFAKGVVPYIQAALPAGYHVAATNTYVDILTGPDGKTNYLFPSTEPASTLSGPLSCHTPPNPGCDETSAAGGNVVVNSGPSGEQSAGYVRGNLQDPRVDILASTSSSGGIQGLPRPTSPTLLLSNAQLAKIMSNSALVEYAKQQLQHQSDISNQLQKMTPPSSGFGSPTGDSLHSGNSSPSGSLSSGGPAWWSSVSESGGPGSQPSGTNSSSGGSSSNSSSGGGSSSNSSSSGPSSNGGTTGFSTPSSPSGSQSSR